MITKLEDGLKSCSLVLLAMCLWRISYLMLNVGWYKLNFISNQVLIKSDQLKLLKCL
jgi:hypothetical protein